MPTRSTRSGAGSGRRPSSRRRRISNSCSAAMHERSNARRPPIVVTTTLDAMASGGMYDHIGGGFTRYSIDRRVARTPLREDAVRPGAAGRHYRQAFSVCGVPAYRQVVEETIEYVLRDLRHPDGGFYSAEDADSPDENGHGVGRPVLHVDTRRGTGGVRSHDVDSGARVVRHHRRGNFTDPRHFQGRVDPEPTAPSRRTPAPADDRSCAAANVGGSRSSDAARASTTRSLTEWNALFLFALADAAAAFQRDDWKAAAVANGEFLLRELRQPNGRWYRSWHADGQPRARHHGPRGRPRRADRGVPAPRRAHRRGALGRRRRQTADTMLDWFWDPHQGGLYTTADDCRPRWWSARKTTRQRHAVSQLRRRARFVATGGAPRRTAIIATMPIGSCSCLRRWPRRRRRQYRTPCWRSSCVNAA